MFKVRAMLSIVFYILGMLKAFNRSGVLLINIFFLSTLTKFIFLFAAFDLIIYKYILKEVYIFRNVIKSQCILISC